MDNNELIKLIVDEVLSKLNDNHAQLKLVVKDDRLNIDEISYLDYQADVNYAEYIIDQLSLKECACLIHGIKGNSKIDFILDHYQKKKFKIKEIVNDNQSLYDIYVDALKKLGYILVADNHNLKNKSDVNNKDIIIDKRVINERDLINKQLQKNDCLRVAKNTIVTPLAYDYMRNNGIRIIKEDANESM